MAWETFENGKFQRYEQQYGSIWTQRPVIVIREDVIICNPIFAETFSFKDKDSVNVSYDTSRKKLAIHRPMNQAASNCAYRVRKQTKNIIINCKQAAKKFPDYCDKAFAAVLNSSEKIIEIQLS
jgi:hypothetical protein